ncbi:MAG: hypothetical protein Q9221_005358 [Calogaya cf. arnoldii]
MSRLSFSDRMCCPSKEWSRLEALPPEIISSVLIHLVFFDRKSLSSTSWRLYDLAGPIKPPDRFAWRIHLCSAFNRCTDDFFDMTIFNPDDITRELTRITQQIKETPKKGHYALDTTKTRLKDLTCLYFPSGFYIQYGSHRFACPTLGHFVAIQFRVYVARLLLETKVGEHSAFERRYINPRIDFTDEHKATLTKEAHRWSILAGRWLQKFSALKSDEAPDGAHLQDSAEEATQGLVRKMGVQEIHGQYFRDDQWWEPVGSLCTNIRSPHGVDLLTLFAGYDADMGSDDGALVDVDEYTDDGNGALPTHD